MEPRFDHEKLRAYQEALRFVGWVGPVLDQLPVKIAAKDQLDRSSTSVVLNIAEGNGKRSHVDRCRYLDIARGSIVESAACLDVLVARKQIAPGIAADGKEILLGTVAIVSGLIARFSGELHESAASYGDLTETKENENE